MRIGDYQILEELGHGSLGKTYLAEHVLLKRPYVLKLLPEELSSDPQFVHRFEVEVAALSLLQHPHIARICNASRSEAHCFLITEFVQEGMNLATYVSQRVDGLAEVDVLHMARQLAVAIDFAHRQAPPIAHGCLKLNNIIIQQKGEDIHATITDFGLSRVIGPPLALSRTYHAVASALALQTEAVSPVRAGPAFPWNLPTSSFLHQSFCQTFAFLAPEQKVGGCLGLHSMQSDNYAFGILLYYLLTQEFPEGYFDLPSKKRGDLKWNWDLLICRLLQTDPLKRPLVLTEKIDEMLSSTEISASVKHLQMVKGCVQEAKLSCVSMPQHPRPVLKPGEITRPAFEPDPGAIFQLETTVAPYRPQTKEAIDMQPLQTEMVIIPGGAYFRGSNHGGRDEMPRHAVNLSPFALDIHPITNEQFVRFLEAMGGEKDGNNNDIIRLRESRIKRYGGKLTIESGYAKHPVVGVTWYGAVAYAKWVGKRLPTEAEWEIAAYGGQEEFLFPTGKEIERSEANFFSSDTTPIMSYAPNGLGLYDMAGNVYEWCYDWYDYHFYQISVQEPDNPTGPAQGVYRILRGGCWKSSREDLRCAHRHRNNPGVMNGTYGFRCAADVTLE